MNTSEPSEQQMLALIAELDHCQNEHLFPELHQKILAAVPAIAPLLTATIGTNLKDNNKLPWAAVHSAKLLGDIGDERAVPVLLDCLQGCDPEDLLFSNAEQALNKVGKPIIDPCLERYRNSIEDDHRNILANLICETAPDDTRLYDIAAETLERDPLYGAWCFYSLGDPQALPLLSARFDAIEIKQNTESLLPGQSLLELQDTIEHLGGQLTAKQQSKLEQARRANRAFAGELEQLFQTIDDEEEAMLESSQPYIRERKIGRNDPCWCGSGKKYKKCHLPLER